MYKTCICKWYFWMYCWGQFFIMLCVPQAFCVLYRSLMKLLKKFPRQCTRLPVFHRTGTKDYSLQNFSQSECWGTLRGEECLRPTDLAFHHLVKLYIPCWVLGSELTRTFWVRWHRFESLWCVEAVGRCKLRAFQWQLCIMPVAILIRSVWTTLKGTPKAGQNLIREPGKATI